jgi:hypothetical protein
VAVRVNVVYTRWHILQYSKHWQKEMSKTIAFVTMLFVKGRATDEVKLAVGNFFR